MKNSSLTKVSRRRFLQVSSALSLLPMLPAASQTWAEAPPGPVGKFFVMLRAQGGADVTLGLDPWTAPALPLASDMFVEYRPEDLIVINPAMKLGPACAALKPHADDFSVVNGVFMSKVDNGHTASLTYICAGSTNSTAPTLPVELARSTVEGDFGVLSDGLLNMGDRVCTSSALDDLKDLPNRADLTSILNGIRTPDARSAFAAAVERILQSGPSTHAFIQNLLAMGKPESLTDSQVLAAAFVSDVASCAQLELRSTTLDTHANHTGTHLAGQTQVWNGVAEIFKLFKNTPYGGSTLFDHTTFMVVSEFSRTPALNGAGGKDHNPMTNSVLLAGRGIKGGQVVGASRLVTAAESPLHESYHIAYPIDYATCEVQRTRTPQARMIFPENVAQTVATVMGVDWKIFHSFAPETLPLGILLKS